MSFWNEKSALWGVSVFALLGVSSPLLAQELKVQNLRCEYQQNPLGIDIMEPRLAWNSQSMRRGATQTAYQILVASSPEKLGEEHADLWNSGKILSDNSLQIAYHGRPLNARQRVWWKVRAWDRDNKPSDWSATQWWEMGLTSPSQWNGKWISLPPNEGNTLNLSDMKWIWYPEGNPVQSAPEGSRYFRLHFSLPEGKAIKSAVFYAVADDSYEAFLNGKAIGTGTSWKELGNHNCESALVAGTNVLAVHTTNGSESPAGLAGMLQVKFQDGTQTNIGTSDQWKTSQEASPNWNAPTFADSVWKNAVQIAEMGASPWGMPRQNSSSPPAPYLRRTFFVERSIKRARVYATALGLYQLHFNGKQITRDMFRPGWTDYHQTVQYQTYDVTSLVQSGKNAVGVILGDGWYCGNIAWAGRKQYGPYPKALVQLEIEYADGKREKIVSDETWKVTTGAILSSDIYMGEVYDARLERNGWSTPEFGDVDWKLAQAEPLQASPNLVASCGSTVQKVMEIHPQKITEKPKGAYIFDLGQNMVGWVRLKVRGGVGKSVRLRFAEILNPDGTIYTTNLRGARCTDTYTLKGEGTEIYEPHFTFHGFRYVEVTGYPGTPNTDSITGVVLTSATDMKGTFTCSNPLVNKLQQNIQWGMRGNYLEIPTDCPQRDERLGWMGDAEVFIRTACFNANVGAFMTKWVRDVREAQSPEGSFTDVVPKIVGFGDSAPAWGDAGVIVPWTVYLFYNDTRLLENHYNAMVGWVEHIRRANPDLIWRKRAGNNYGDWLNVNSDTPREVLATGYFAYSTHLVAKAARVLGKTEDAEKYEALFQQISAAFQKEFVGPDTRIKGDTQTAYLVALKFELLPENQRLIAAKYLVDDITQKRNGHLATGFVGVGYLNPMLTAYGRSDIAYRLLQNDTYPSWGYSIRQGATTIWERWDGWTTEKGFQDPGMNSFNHYSLGSVGEWMFGSVAGESILDPQQPAFKHIVMTPNSKTNLQFVKATHESLYGTIASEWKRDSKRTTWRVTIPANTKATLTIPVQEAQAVREGMVSASEAEGVHFVRTTAEGVVFEVSSGTYTFTF